MRNSAILQSSRVNAQIVGPLLWHWENNTTNDTSIELDLDEVKALARAIGFKIEVRLQLMLLSLPR